VFQKSDAKIQITITTAHLIRNNYHLSSFHYRLFGTNVGNFNKIHRTVSEQQLFKQVAQLSQRERAAGWDIYGQKWKTVNGRQYFTDIIGLPFRSYRSLLFKFGTFCVFQPPFGGLETTYDVHLWKARTGLPISVN